ncbi:restriction endonuclease subunit S [Nocardiopsis protaetiae]|uniref:restriction endonuclease subunit S n=1 Tax=Nocardiopsis protaetiae TaxID=3382270 RepID=UPI00387B8180
MPKDIGENVILEETIARISTEDAQRLSKYLLAEGDIVYSRRGDVERRALIRAEQEGWLCGTGCLRVRPGDSVNPRFLSYYLGHPEVRRWIVQHAVGATMPNLNTGILGATPTVVPPPPVQKAIADTLGALDDKIAVNERIADASRQLGVALYRKSIASEPRSIAIEALSNYLNRGQAPKYTEDEDGMTVLNQRCVRAGRVLLDPARRTLVARVQDARRLKPGDVLVNSTGVGTLGRVAIWSHVTEATVDSHVTIVRINPEVVPTVVGGFAMLTSQPRIEALGEGSTGQTELSKAKLGQLEIEIPSGEASVLAARLTALEEKADAALAESRTLAELRDTLLPQLMSGKLRVKDAEKIVEDNV